MANRVSGLLVAHHIAIPTLSIVHSLFLFMLKLTHIPQTLSITACWFTSTMSSGLLTWTGIQTKFPETVCFIFSTISALTLLAGHQEEYSACKN